MAFILEPNRTTFMDLNCAVTCFDEIKEMKDVIAKNETHPAINNVKGHRFDSAQHNWYIINEFLSLSFSFMTFVIKEKIENEDSLQRQNVFDITPYNYLFNKSTAFIDSSFVRFNHEMLEKVLINLSKEGLEYLSQLHYFRQKTIHVIPTQEKFNIRNTLHIDREHNTKQVIISPMQIAVEEGNNRAVDILLKFESMSQGMFVNKVKNIIDKIVPQTNFLVYAKNMPI